VTWGIKYSDLTISKEANAEGNAREQVVFSKNMRDIGGVKPKS
jgi:hypothetical protein